MKAIKITTDDLAIVVDIKDLKDMQKHVGGYIETTRSFGLNNLDVTDNFSLLMIVNEEGKNQKLPYNEVATDALCNWDDIAGDVLIMQEGFVDGEPDIVGLSDEQVKDLMDIFENDYDMKVME